ncbi:hypothetical protein HK100_005301 [Physocladia obscura]|uniref:W2 domain-containing protein n=1 Tax=Physocladia obscura TaxID=109957 RepID=A0AAD5SSP2_9FUNG|nr:hypothetical protein HK100_005301 [Physocladia obscura]
MPKIQSKIEGKGNGIKTVVPNITDVAQALSRSPAYVTKYFGFELGAQTKIDEKTNRHIVNGAHDAQKLQSVLDGFITKFVLCQSCKNPETDLIIQKGDIITKNCNACGANLPVDLRHKLCAYIIKNPPAISNATAKAHAAASNSTDRMNLGTSSSAPEEADEENDAADQDQILDEFANFVTEILTNADPEADIAIMDKASDLGIKDSKAVIILMQLLFTAEMLEANQIKHHAALLHYFVKNEKGQKALLGGLETFVSTDDNGIKEALYERVALILKAFYDEELLEEDVCLAWGEKASKKYVDKKTAKEIREKAEPFLHWLRTAEETDDEDD